MASFTPEPSRAAPLYSAVPILEEDRSAAVVDALPVDEPLPSEALDSSPRPPNGIIRRLYAAVASLLEWGFGATTLIFGLAILAALPVLQFLSLGYLLEAGGRVARTGRLRDGFVGVRLAARPGGMVACSCLLFIPARIVAGLARSAQVIDPGGRIAEAWRVGLTVLIAVTALHVGSACLRGGRIRYFLWPFNFVWLIRRLARGGYYPEARDAVWRTVTAFRLPYLFSIGLRGFLGAFVWLALPITLLAQGQRGTAGGTLAAFAGAALLGFVLLYLPFLQIRMAATNRFSEVFAVRAVRADYRRAPWAFAFAFVLTLIFALPLYLLKIEIVPREAAWLPSLVFVAFIFPARLITGWALGRAAHRPAPRHWFFRWTGRLPLLPAAAFYVLIAYFTQFTSWNGVWSLYEQHAFLLPVPFFGL
jgi:hypothetical protein